MQNYTALNGLCDVHFIMSGVWKIRSLWVGKMSKVQIND